MKSIIMISPSYLEVAYKEALKYDFTLQGYGSFENGSKGLLKVNVSDILGYVYFANQMPDNLESFEEFLYRCNLYGNNKNFLIALIDTKGIHDIDYQKYSNLTFSYIAISEVVTDLVINRDIFGSILLHNYQPYIFEEKQAQSINFGDVYKLRYEPLFSSYILRCLYSVNRLETFEETLQADMVYHEYVKDSSVLAEIRKFYIKTYFEAGLDNTKLYDLVKYTGNQVSFGAYMALIELVSADVVIKGGD